MNDKDLVYIINKNIKLNMNEYNLYLDHIIGDTYEVVIKNSIQEGYYNRIINIKEIKYLNEKCTSLKQLFNNLRDYAKFRLPKVIYYK